MVLLPEIPQRVSLIAQTEIVLTNGITSRRWQGHLPPERELSAELLVGRSTLRAALAILAKQKLLRPRHGRTWEINGQAANRTSRVRLKGIGCLSQDPLERLDSFGILWQDDLRVRLQRIGQQFKFYHRPRCFGESCPAKLAELIRLNPDNLWILLNSNRSMQHWFQEQGVSSIVAGSLHDGITLPSIDGDLRSMGRHAGGMLFARGHRRIALLASRHGRSGVLAGHLEIERGMREACAASRFREGALTVVYHGGKVDDVCRAMGELLLSPQSPSAAVIIDTDTLLTVMTYMAYHKQRIPRDLSIITCYDEPFFPRIVPELTHYKWEPQKFSRHFYHLVQAALQDVLAPDECVRIMPRFVLGQTLGSARCPD